MKMVLKHQVLALNGQKIRRSSFQLFLSWPECVGTPNFGAKRAKNSQIQFSTLFVQRIWCCSTKSWHRTTNVYRTPNEPTEYSVEAPKDGVHQRKIDSLVDFFLQCTHVYVWKYHNSVYIFEGSILQWHPEMKIGFAFIPTYLHLHDPANTRGGVLQQIVKDCILANKSWYNGCVTETYWRYENIFNL